MYPPVLYTSDRPLRLGYVTTTVFLEAFGRLTPGTAVIDIEAEDLYSVFHGRAELMGWSALTTQRPVFWDMNEAELTAGDASSRIGWAQVGIVGKEDPLGALPALGQCLDDALRRFGTLTLTGLQVSISNLRFPGRGQAAELFPENWFNLSRPVWSQAHLAFDQTWATGLVTVLPRYFPFPPPEDGNRSFAFGSVVALPARHRIQIPAETPFVRNLAPASRGLVATLPEWNASAAAWVLALALRTARDLSPGIRRDWAVRVTRVQGECGS